MKIYANPRGSLYWADGQEGVNYANGYSNGEQSLGFYYGEETGIVTATDSTVQVTIGEKSVQLTQDYEMIMYPRILVREGKLLFAAYAYQETENCHNDFCICHVGESKLFEYDFESETIQVRHTLDPGEYFISFDLEMFSYYSDGKVLRNDDVVLNVEAMDPQGEFIIKGEAHAHQPTYGSLSVFYDDGIKVWYTRFDNPYYADIYYA